MARWVIYSLYTELYFSFFVRNKSIQVLYIRDTAKITINSSQYYCKIKMLITSSLFKMPIIMMAAQERLLICNVSYKYSFFHMLHFFYKKGARIFVNDNFFHCFFWRNTILEIIIAILRLIVSNHVKWMTSNWDKITIHVQTPNHHLHLLVRDCMHYQGCKLEMWACTGECWVNMSDC